MENIIALCKRKGFIFPGSEIYGGLSGTWDYGPLGVALRNNIKALWWKRFVTDREDMYGVDAAILMNGEVWKASGHVAGFSDPLVEDVKTGKRYRADHLLEEVGVDVKGMTLADLDAAIKSGNNGAGLKSPEGNALGDVRQFNMMFKTHIGPVADDDSISYLRPETAQGMFVNFKNVIDSMHPKIPFGLAQIGKAFRNEIAPRDFIFRDRELEQMEIEYFVHPDNWKEAFEDLFQQQLEFAKEVGLDMSHVHKVDIAAEDRAHYSSHSVDTEFDFPFGQKELFGLAYRTDYDLKKHTEHSSVDLSYFDEETKVRYVPHCIEPTFGVERTMLAVLCDAYTVDELGGEKREYLKLSPKIAPVLVAVSPLLKNKPELVAVARKLYADLKKKFGRVSFDDNGNIGKRYRRQDEIGTPFCVVVDFETIEGVKDAVPANAATGVAAIEAGAMDTVTIRYRDSGEQERVAIADLAAKIEELIG
jgi:glycyl-tRNA synthetase